MVYECQSFIYRSVNIKTLCWRFEIDIFFEVETQSRPKIITQMSNWIEYVWLVKKKNIYILLMRNILDQKKYVLNKL